MVTKSTAFCTSGIAQPKLPHVGIGDRHRHLRLDLADVGDEVGRRHFAAQQDFVADDHGGDDVGISFGKRDRGLDLPAGLGRIAGNPHAMQHLQSVPPCALQHIGAPIVHRIGPNAVGVLGQQRQILFDLPRLNAGSLHQRILAVAKWRIGQAVRLPDRRRRRRDLNRCAEPPPNSADHERRGHKGRKRRADGGRFSRVGHGLPLTLQSRRAKTCDEIGGCVAIRAGQTRVVGVLSCGAGREDAARAVQSGGLGNVPSRSKS